MAWLRIMVSFALSLVLLMVLGAFSIAKANTPDQALFLKAEEFYQKNKPEKAQPLLGQLKNYPLYPYLLLLAHQSRIDAVTLKEVTEFERLYPNFAFTSDLRRQWLRFHAQKEDWHSVALGYTNQTEPDLICANALAHYEIKKKLNLENIFPIWKDGSIQANTCEQLFRVHLQQIGFNKSLLWERLSFALKKENTKLIQSLLTLCSESEKKDFALWKKIHAQPKLLTTQNAQLPQNPGMAKVVMINGISRIAKQDPNMAALLFHQYEKKLKFSAEDNTQLFQAIGFGFAQKNPSQAKTWLSKIKGSDRNEKVQEWTVRLALREGKWSEVLRSVLNMEIKLLENPKWQYWKARSLDQLGSHVKAQKIYTELAKQNNYYGYLASLNLKTSPTPKTNAQTQALPDKKLAEQINFIRVKEWRALKRRYLAKREWDFATQNFNDHDLAAAAKLAYSWGWIDEAIRTSNRIQNLTDLKLRFPTPHKENVLKAAKDRTLDPSLIYSVTRQESLFFSEAKSGAGACGLMQLMPRTAKEEARKQQIPLKRVDDLSNPSTNIALGAGYLSRLLQSNDAHPVVATAAYNAGPNRVRQWLPEQNMAADVWIETMPYDETRDYVKNVMSFSVVYDYLLGHPSKLGQRLRLIPGKVNLEKVAEK